MDEAQKDKLMTVSQSGNIGYQHYIEQKRRKRIK
jgi:hypothetical protein